MTKLPWLASLAMIALVASVDAQPVPSPAVTGTLPTHRTRTEAREGYTLAFVDADVRRVVDAVMGAMLGADYSIDSKVQGNVTLRTAKPVAAEALVPMLEATLQSVDAVVLLDGGRYRIVPRADARGRAPLLGGDASGPISGYSTEIVTLRYGSPTQVAQLLEQFLGKEVVSGINASLSQVLIAGSAEERRAAHALISRFDVDELAGMNYSIIKLDNTDPDTLQSEMQRIFKPPFDVLGARVRIVALPRLHSVLTIAANRDDLNRVEPWIRRLDSGGTGKRKLYSYAIQNGRARDIAASLQLVLGAQVSVSAAPNSAPSSALATSGFGSLSSGQATSGGVEASTTSPLKEPSETMGADTPLPGSSTPILQPVGGNGPRIVPNDNTNSLLMYANGEEYELIKSALDQIDRPVPQVLIEATLAEVTLTKDFSAGVDWSVLSGNSSFKLNNTANATPTASFPGFSYGYIGATAQVILNTLQSKTNVRVLSAPKLIVLNNQTASLQVGDQVPIVTQQSQSTSSAGAPVINSVELHDTGVILKVTPRVNDSGNVQLDIAQEVSDVSPTTTSGINSPTIQQRRLATTVTTRSGQMIALGGLIRSNVSRQRSGFPILSQIPIIGAAFGNQVDRADRTELVILLTPTVMRTPNDVNGTVNELLDRMASTRPLLEADPRRAVSVPPLRR